VSPPRVALLDLRADGTDRELEAFFAACPGSVAQQTPGWRRTIEALGVDQARVLACRIGDELAGVLPAYRFAGPLGAILVSCAQAGPLGGVACRGERDAVYTALLEAFLELASVERCAVATVITNPFEPDRELCEARLAPDFVLENSCQVLDLVTGLDEAGQPLLGSTHLRRHLRRACTGELAIDEQQDAETVAAWWRIHEARHREIGTEPLPLSLFEAALAHAVPAGVARFFFVRRGGVLAGGGLYLHHGAVIDALMPSVSSEHAPLGVAYLLALHSMRWARARGIRHYNWQPSPPDGGVYRFKRQWGSRDLSYAYLTRITGDAAPLLASSAREIRERYPFHYVLPFDRLGGGAGPGVSTRRDAWNAAEGTP
jgi:hypothetical protein